MKHGFTPGCPGCEAVQAGTPPRGHTEPCRMRIETAMRGDKDGGEARVARAEIARAVASGSSMEIDTDIAPPLAALAEPPPSSSTGPLLGAETPSIGASSSRKRTAAGGGDETVTAMADDRPDTERELQESEATVFRSAVMRLGFLALDRPDIQFGVKEAARGMARPTVRPTHAEEMCQVPSTSENLDMVLCSTTISAVYPGEVGYRLGRDAHLPDEAQAAHRYISDSTRGTAAAQHKYLSLCLPVKPKPTV